jgi:hypothetical protein
MSSRSSLTFAVFSSALLFAACVADLGDAPGDNHGAAGENGSGDGGSTGGGNAGAKGTAGTTGSGTGGAGNGSGGTQGTAGRTGTAGSGAGGNAPGTGGRATGGTPGTGGRATGGTPGMGGSGMGGRGMGGSGMGGAQGMGGVQGGGQCNWNGGPNTTGGQLTCYWLGQPNVKGGGCPSFKTFCGYCGSETGSNNGQFCPSGIVDTVPNTFTGNFFAAFPIGTFGQGTFCGMCVQITFQGKSVVATVVDECATCPESGHLDLSLPAAAALGLTGNTGTATGVSWHAVSCPASGSNTNIVAFFNAGSSQQIYFQNVIFPVAKAVAGGRTASQAFGFWDFGTPVGGQQVTLTDTLGHVITGTVPTSSGGSINAQFPMLCQ